MELKELFNKPRTIGLCADVNNGKSNLIYHALTELQKDYKFQVYTFGLRCPVPGTNEIFSVEQLEQITNSVIIIDEMFSLFDLDDRQIKKQIETTLRLIHHNNNVLLLCGLGENFKKFIGAKLDALIFKKVTIAELINGGRVKRIITNYAGAERGHTLVKLEKSEAIIYDGKGYNKIEIPYMSQYDSKAGNVSILVEKSVLEKVV